MLDSSFRWNDVALNETSTVILERARPADMIRSSRNACAVES